MNSNRQVFCIVLTSVVYWLEIVNGWKSSGSQSSYRNSVLSRINSDSYYPCSFNTMCQCASQPNETTPLQMNCIEVSLYKFPEFLHNSVRHLVMSKTHLQQLEEETLQGLHLESLKLVDNNIHDISERCFSSMTHSLASIDLSGNEFQQVPLNSVGNLHTLNRLILQRNYISSVDGDWGYLIDSLRSLYLSGNSISYIDSTYGYDDSINGIINTNNNNNNNHQYNNANNTDHQLLQPAMLYQQQTQPQIIQPHIPNSDSFEKLRKLVWLDLSCNRITNIGSNSLPQSLVTIDLSNNLLTRIPTAALDRLADLKVLNLKENMIVSIDGLLQPSAFTMLDGTAPHKKHLEKLDLNTNHIEALPSYLFNGSVTTKAVNLARNFITHIGEGAFYGMNIMHMVLGNNQIKTIDDAAFSGLENTLEYLDLDYNCLVEVPPAITTLNKLRYLYLTSNELTNVSNLSTGLRVLSLGGNNFSSIPVEDVQNCTDLSYFNMGYNKIAEINENDFMGWGGKLETLLLRNNKISRLNYGSFNGLDAIKEISLSFNDIHYVQPNVFENISRTLKILELSFGIYRDDFPIEELSCLTELMWLGLDNNNLKYISDDSLTPLKELTYINLGFNRIAALPHNMFVAEIHRHLMDVDFSYNLITRLLYNTFDSLAELQTVTFSSNKIHLLERHCFHNLPYLAFVDITFNQLRNISENAFAFLPSLVRLDLMHNRMQSFSLKVFRHVSNASLPLHLNISHNALTHFDGEINTFLYVHALDVSENQLSETNCFKNLSNALRLLYMQGNCIQALGNHAFGDLEWLEVLNLSHNNISTLRRRSFQGLNSLQELDLSYNKIEQLQVEQFSNLKKLRRLSLNNNRLRNLPREVFMNTRIEFLDLAANMLSVWPVPAFSDIGFTLRSIDFSHNHLEFLDSTMFINTLYLYELNLARNKITVLPDNTFTLLNNLTNLDLNHNPLITTNLREIFLHTPHLRTLNLSCMGLNSMPYMNLKNLFQLDVSDNYLKDIKPMNEMSRLHTLRIANNKIENATGFVQLLPQSLRVLDVSRNHLKRISFGDFAHLQQLVELRMFDIRVHSVNMFAELRHLKSLYITSQYNFGAIVAAMPGLQELYVTIADDAIDDNLFVKLANNTKLRYIEISGRRLQSITSNALLGLARNRDLKIKITKTQITDLPAGLFYALKGVPRLNIDLSENQIASLSPDTFYPNASSWDAVGTRSILGGVDIMNNPLLCDCGLVWVGHWLRRWLREMSQINALTRDDFKEMIMRARRNTCIDQVSGQTLPFLEIFPEDLLCHASALSSSAQTPLLPLLTDGLYFVVLPMMCFFVSLTFSMTYN